MIESQYPLSNRHCPLFLRILQSMPDKKTFVINTNNSLILSIYHLMGKKPAIGKKLCQQIYHLSLLDQKEMSPELLNQFIQSSRELLTEITQQIETA